MFPAYFPPRLLRGLVAALGFASVAGAQCLEWSTNFAPPSTGNGMNDRVFDMAVHYGVSPSQPPYLGLYAGGDFTVCGATSTAANRIACWDGTQWKPLGSGCDASVYALTAELDASNTQYGLLVGGAFTTAGGTTVNHIARWSAGFAPLTDTSSVTGTNGDVFSLRVLGNDLYLGGTFTNAGSTSASNIARWNGSNFFALGTGANGRVEALDVFDDDGSGSNPAAIFAGGIFSSAGGVTGTNLIAKWTGTSWQSVGGGLTGSAVWDLCTFDLDGAGSNPPELFAAGLFTMAGSTAVNNIARWNGTTWSVVGAGLNSVVRDLHPFHDGSGAKLYATGFFTADGSNSTTLDRIAKFDTLGSLWLPLWGPDLGGGGNMSLCLGTYDDLKGLGPDLYAGSMCTTAQGNPSSYIAQWHGCTWAPLPMIGGEVAVTRKASVPDDFSVALVDLRPPEAPVATNWYAPMYHNELNGQAAHVWTQQNLGDVFGITFDKQNPPNIYVAATTCYGSAVVGPGGWGGVYKLGSVGGTISVFASVINNGAGLGDVCHDPSYRLATPQGQIFISNYYDGTILRYDMSGSLQQTYDPFFSTINTPFFVQLGERVWALAIFNQRELYFSVWLRDWGRRTTPWPAVWGTQGSNITNNAIFRVSLDATGAILPSSLVLVEVMPYLPNETYSNPVSDIAFSPNNKRMLLAENSQSADSQPAHWDARVLEYVGGGPGAFYVNWVPSATQYQVGCLLLNGEYHQAEGGADYDCTDRVIASGEPLANTGLNVIIGLQRIPAAGNNSTIGTSTSHLIDIDGEPAVFDKLGVGDVEVWRPTCKKKWYSYCTAKVNSLGCTPAVDAVGDPSLAAGGGFFVQCHEVRNNKSGLLFYSVNGPGNAAFQGGTLCVAPPVKRTPGIQSGGSPAPASDCSGKLQIDMTAFALGALGGNPLPALSMPGTVVDCQFWSRDPGYPPPENTSLSDALEYAVEP